MRTSAPYTEISRKDDHSLKKLDEFCDLKDITNLKTFLDSCPELYPVLIEACRKLVLYFPESKRKLILRYDPDSHEENSYLSLRISANLPFEEAIESLNKFESDWWIDNYYRAKDKLVINLD